jgi:hypothetical protein
MAILEYMDSVAFDFDPRLAKGRYVYVLSHKEKIRISSRGRTSSLPPELVRKAKLLFHYRGMSPKEIQRLDEFKSVSTATISGWIQKKNHEYISPHLNSFKDMRKEKEQECLSLYDKGFTRKQIHEILGLEYSYVKKNSDGSMI